MAETVIALPVLWLVFGGAIELGLLFEAKATLNHAVLQAARSGMVNNANPAALQDGLARGLLPLFSPEGGVAGAQQALDARVRPDVQANSRIRILNPTVEAFADFGEIGIGGPEIPNDELHRRSTATGTVSGLNIQDANLLKVQVVYGAPLRVPLVREVIAELLLAANSGLDGFERGLLESGRLPIIATTTVRMQSPARLNGLMVSRVQLPLDLPRVRPGQPPL